MKANQSGSRRRRIVVGGITLLAAILFAGPDGLWLTHPAWPVLGLLVAGFAAICLIAMVCADLTRDAATEIETSGIGDIGSVTERGSSTAARGVPPHDPPEDPPTTPAATEHTEDAGDLYSIYSHGVRRGMQIVEAAHRLRPAHEVCGTAE